MPQSIRIVLEIHKIIVDPGFFVNHFCVRDTRVDLVLPMVWNSLPHTTVGMHVSHNSARVPPSVLVVHGRVGNDPRTPRDALRHRDFQGGETGFAIGDVLGEAVDVGDVAGCAYAEGTKRLRVVSA